ncbi:hypothetical protein B0A55_07507 [Friedmanniomyces simplex]|uniref:Las1-domain-containing protein n=1 Tax=Friedmanniomyces simplex TaxID=329884 RepID=A0A4U0X218_9PEZI|nr:hypothetical protein B0A55_07507 [Friedmanniomyces simplex]
MPRYTIHPWRTHSDLLAVRTQLYHLDKSSPDSRRHAVDRILSCWKLRGNLPHAVESTALLIDAQLHHHSQTSNHSDFALRAVYTAAFTRFVTGFCDIGRSREGLLQPSSMLDVAKRIGMPVHFVGLRHEAVHEELPSLGRLVKAVEEALRWLWEVYWSRLEGAGSGEGESGGKVDDGEVKDEARRMLKAFRSARREAFRMKRQGSAEHGSEVEGFARACSGVFDGGRGSVEVFATVLVEERFLFPSGRSLGDSMDGAFTLWDPLLCRLVRSQRTFAAAVIERLQAQMTEGTAHTSNDAVGEATALWLLHALELADTSAANGSRDKNGRTGTIRVCCLYPSHWTRMVGQRLLDSDADLSVDWRDLFEASSVAVGGEGMEVDTETGAAPDGLDRLLLSAPTLHAIHAKPLTSTPIFKMKLTSSALTIALATTVSAAIVPANSTANVTWPYQTFKTTNFTPPYLQISHYVGPSDTYLFFAPDGPKAFETAPLIMDMNGELIWNGPATHAFSFGTQVYDDEPVLVWWNGTLYPEPIGRGNGVVHMLNQRYEPIRNTTLAGNFQEQVPNATFPSNIDVHEIFITKNGSMLVTANNVTQADLTSVGGPKDGWVVAALIFEIDIATNQVLFSWNSLDHLDQLPFTDSLLPLGSEGLTGANQSLAWGYFHINSVAPYCNNKDDDGGSGYILSSRFFCTAVALSPNGTILWRLQGRTGGDFTLGPGVDFCYQHDVRAFPTNEQQQQQRQLHTTSSSDNASSNLITLHMHDNHNSPIENNTVPSSAKSLLLDLGTHHATLQHRYLNASGPIYSTAQGDLQPLENNGHVFVGHGWIPILEEFSHSGEILTTVQFAAAEARPGGEGGFVSAEAPTLSYRAFRQGWVGCPRTKPEVWAEKGTANGTGTGAGTGTATVVYMSWNGATEVEAWEVYSGGSSATLECVDVVAKTGFETMAFLADAAAYVQVKPRLRERGYGGLACEVVASEVVAVVG